MYDYEICIICDKIKYVTLPATSSLSGQVFISRFNTGIIAKIE